MVEVVYFLSSILLYQVLCSILKQTTISLILAVTPFFMYVYVNNLLTFSPLIILTTLLIVLTFVLLVRKKASFHVGLSVIAMLWFMALGKKLENFFELGLIIIGLNLVSFVMGGTKYFKNYKLLREESGIITSSIILLVGILTLMFVIPGGISGFLLTSSVEDKVFQGVLMVYIFFSLKGFGPTSLAVNKKRNIDKAYLSIKNALELVVIPSVLCMNVKDIINNSMIFTAFLPILFSFVAAYVYINLKRNMFDIRSSSIAIFQVITVSFLYLVTAEFESLVFVVSLIFNYLIFQHIISGSKLFIKKSYYDLFYLGGPISPLFYVKLFYLNMIFNEITPFMGLLLLIFMFLPLLGHPFLGYKGVECE